MMQNPERGSAKIVFADIESRRKGETDLEVHALWPGVILAEDVITATGVLFAACGQKISKRMVERLPNSEHLFQPHQRIRVILPQDGAQEAYP